MSWRQKRGAQGAEDLREPLGFSTPRRRAPRRDAALIKPAGEEWDVTPARVIHIESSHYAA